MGPPGQIGSELACNLAWIAKGSIALLLVGHGGLGIWAAKREWFDFLGWFGVTDSSQALDLMVGVGVFEVVLGIAVLYRPLRSLLVLVLVWKLGTELLRPLVGQPNYQFVERAGDYVLPLALFWLVGAVLPARRDTWSGHFHLGLAKENNPMLRIFARGETLPVSAVAPRFTGRARSQHLRDGAPAERPFGEPIGSASGPTRSGDRQPRTVADLVAPERHSKRS